MEGTKVHVFLWPHYLERVEGMVHNPPPPPVLQMMSRSECWAFWWGVSGRGAPFTWERGARRLGLGAGSVSAGRARDQQIQAVTRGHGRLRKLCRMGSYFPKVVTLLEGSQLSRVIGIISFTPAAASSLPTKVNYTIRLIIGFYRTSDFNNKPLTTSILILSENVIKYAILILK